MPVARLIKWSFVVFVFSVMVLPVYAAEIKWTKTTLQPGLEYATFTIAYNPSFSDGVLHVVRADPKTTELYLMLRSEQNKMQPTNAWCKEFGLAVAINAGMYRKDYRTNTGYLKNGSHLNNPKWNPKYQSVLAFGPAKEGIPAAIMLDLDAPKAKQQLSSYRSVVQNLRLIKAPGRNVWSKQDKKWSEAAVAMDKQGNVLFFFSRTPMTMKDFNDKILSLPLEVVAAMHVEGGPEASLSIHAGGVDLDLFGSYETGFNENDHSVTQWPLPNVIGVRAVNFPNEKPVVR